MTQNPYEPSISTSANFGEQSVCVRRLDVAFIAATFALLAVASFVVIAIPSANAWVMPRFGWCGSLVLFPLNFLFLYLWKPAPRLLALASAMFFFTATINAATLAYKGTVPNVTNAFNDRLPSAYAWAVLPLVLAGLYVALVAWQTRRHVLPEPKPISDGG